MSRSKWKGPFFQSTLFNTIFNNTKKMTLKLFTRNSVVPYKLIGQVVQVHNGKSYKLFYITREKVGFKFGAFINTRKHTYKPEKA